MRGIRVGGADQRASSKRFSPIRRLTAVSTLSFAAAYGIIAVLVAGGLIWTSTLLQHTLAVVIRDTRSQALADELQVSLLTYHRLSGLFTLTRERDVNAAKAERAADIRRLLAEAEEHIGSEEERELLDETSEHVIVYLDQHARLESRGGLSSARISRRSRPALSRALADLQQLGDLNDSEVRRAERRAEQVNNLSNVVGLVAGVVLGLGLLTILLGVRWYILRPLYSLHATMKRVRSGEPEARMRDRGVREVAELADGFNELAEALERQRDNQLTFLAGVAHDLRNPLSALKVGLETLDVDQPEPRRRRTRERLERQIDRLTRMVGDLVDVARIEAGQLEVRSELFDVRRVVKQMVELYAPTSRCRISTTFSSEPAMVEGDPVRIEQVVGNLLSNAIKFSPDGGPITIEVGTEQQEIVLSVSDRGVGISAEDLDTIFLPFRRTKLGGAPGTGLGLDVVRRIITAHGGRIDVESQPGSGSTFRVTLPRADSEALPAHSSPRRPETPELSPT